MRAFLSHSSKDKEVVTAVYNSLEKDVVWIDRAEIEWGDLFLEKIAEGIKSATDFVLFWSAAAAKSGWVRLEINMAFVQALRDKAIRLRVVVLDDTPLPLYLKPFHVFSVAGTAGAANEITNKLFPVLRQPVRSARARFVNRHSEIERIESAVDDPEFFAIVVWGFTGVGKSSVIREALRRIYEGAEPIEINIAEGTGIVELAIALNASARNTMLQEALSQKEIAEQIQLSLETIAKDRRLLILSNIQHWLDEEGEPRGPLPLLLNVIRNTPSFAQRSVFFTATRRPSFDAATSKQITSFHLSGLSDEHIATLVRIWHFSIHGNELPPEQAFKIAPQLYGHPVAARLVAGILGDCGVEYLDKYPRELIKLRRDLATLLSG